jgi:hypothetical protein
MEAELLVADKPKSKRRWFQFRMRTLLVAVTVVAVQCAVCLPALREWHTRKEAGSINTTSQVMKLQSFQCFPYTSPRRPQSAPSMGLKKTDVRGVASAQSD